MLNWFQHFFKTASPQPQLPTIYCYGEAYLALSEAEIQPAIDWLFSHLSRLGYGGEVHLYWYDDQTPYPCMDVAALEGVKRKDWVFAYRCGGHLWSLPEDFHWKVIPEDTTMRIYQLCQEEALSQPSATFSKKTCDVAVSCV